VRGRFADVSGTIVVPEDPAAATVDVVVQMASVSTGNDDRDAHLRSADFFDAEQFATMTFRSTGGSIDGDDVTLSGELTIKGVSKPVSFDVEFDGVAKDPWGGTRAAFTAEGEINRKDWGLEWNVALETGGVLVSDKVKIQLDVQAVLQQTAVPSAGEAVS
jgi:polyisoprenoid-binding protein YceI